MLNTSLKRFVVVYLLVLIFSPDTDVFAQGASGLHNPLFGAAALAQGNAFTARADDASAIHFNPAGLTQLEGLQVSLGSAFMFPFAEYQGPSGSQDMDTKIIIQPNIYFAGPIVENKLAAGLGVTAPYGLQGKWRNNGFSRFKIADFSLRVIDVNPSIAFKPFSFLSIGAGLDYYYTKVDTDKRINVAFTNFLLGGGFDPNTPEGFQDLELHGDALGYNVGLLFNITPRHSIGISFRSKADIHLEDKLKISNLSGLTASLPPPFGFGSTDPKIRVRTSATLPEMLSFGYAYRHGDLWSIEADVQWTNWSRFDVLKSSFFPTNAILELPVNKEDVRNWRNTLSFALGGEYKVNEALRVRGGYTYHETPVPSTTFEPSVPQSSRHSIFAGFGYHWEKKWIDFAYGAVFYEDRDINNTVGEDVGGPLALGGVSLDGDYNLFTHIIAVNFNFRF